LVFLIATSIAISHELETLEEFDIVGGLKYRIGYIIVDTWIKTYQRAIAHVVADIVMIHPLAGEIVVKRVHVFVGYAP
jgi:hypothetical protein